MSEDQARLVVEKPASTLLVYGFRTIAFAGAAYFIYRGFPYEAPGAELLTLLAALFVIGVLDVGLSHGDTADVDTSLLVAGLYLYGPHWILLLCTISRVVIHVIAVDKGGATVLADALAKRYTATIISLPALHVVQLIELSPRFDVYVHVALLGTLYSVVQLVAGQVGRARSRGDSVLRLLAGNVALQGPLMAAGISVAVLVVVIIDDMGLWAIALTVLLLLTMRQSFALLLDIRTAYQSTIEALVGAMEAQQIDDSGRGVGEKVAAMARTVGAELGWFGSRLERMGYAALLHYFGLYLNPITARGEQDDNPLSEVEFLRPVAPILVPLEGSSLEGVRQRDLKTAYVVALVVENYSPGRGTEALQRLSERVDPVWIAKANRAMRKAQAKT